MKHVWLLRDLFFHQQASLGTCLVYDGNDQIFKSESLERGWVNNMNMISCLPECDVPLLLEHSPRFRKDLWEIKDTGHRTECKFHVSNYFWQLNGCVALGNNREYIDGDAVMDITSSRKTMKLFHKALYPDTAAVLHIRNVPSLPMIIKPSLWKSGKK